MNIPWELENVSGALRIAFELNDLYDRTLGHQKQRNIEAKKLEKGSKLVHSQITTYSSCIISKKIDL